MSRSRSDASFRSTLLTASISSPTSRSFNSRKGVLCATCTRSVSGDAETAESATFASPCKPGSLLIAIFVLRTRQQFEERVETPVERAPELRNRSVDGVQGQSRVAILEFQPAPAKAGNRALGTDRKAYTNV